MNKFRNLFIAALAVIMIPAMGLAVNQETKTLEEQIHKEIATIPDYGLFDIISFEVDGGTVTLTGKLYNAFVRKTAEKRVTKLEGVSKVVNNIEILSGSSFDNQIRRNMVRSANNMAGLYRYLIGSNPDVRIIVDRGRISLEGNVANDSDKNLINIVAQGVPGVFSVTNNLNVSVNKKH